MRFHCYQISECKIIANQNWAYMALVDIKDAYYSIPINEEYSSQNFIWMVNIMLFSVCPMGMAWLSALS